MMWWKGIWVWGDYHSRRAELERWSPAALRLAIVGRRWWEDWSFGEQLLAADEE